MKKIVLLLLNLLCCFLCPAQWMQMGEHLIGSGATGINVGQGDAVSLSADGKTLAVSASNDNNRIGATWVYNLSGNGWVQKGNKITGSGYSTSTPLQGYSISLSADGKTLATGAFADNNGIGATWVYSLSDTGWVQMGNKLVGSGLIGRAGFGASVSLSADGKILAIGGSEDNGGRGATWVYALSNGGWMQMGNKLVGGGAIGDFGSSQGSTVSLSADGKTLAVGGPWDDNNFDRPNLGNIGATWIFTLSDTGWVQKDDKLVGSGGIGDIGQGFALSISADGKTLAVGGLNDNHRMGATWVFKLIENKWIQVGKKVVGTGGIGHSAQGFSVSLSADGKILAASGGDDNNQAGATWIYSISDTNWVQIGKKLVGDGGLAQQGGTGQGASVCLSADGKTLAIGGPNDNNRVGATWVYTTNSIITGLINTSEENILFSPNPTLGLITIRSSQTGNLEIYDTKGLLLKKLKTESLDQQVDISDLKAGAYLYRFKMIDGVKYGKIVKE